METYNQNQIEQLLQIEKETLYSVDHREIPNGEKMDKGKSVSGMTITTSMTSHTIH